MQIFHQVTQSMQKFRQVKQNMPIFQMPKQCIGTLCLTWSMYSILHFHCLVLKWLILCEKFIESKKRKIFKQNSNYSKFWFLAVQKPFGIHVLTSPAGTITAPSTGFNLDYTQVNFFIWSILWRLFMRGSKGLRLQCSIDWCTSLIMIQRIIPFSITLRRLNKKIN